MYTNPNEVKVTYYEVKTVNDTLVYYALFEINEYNIGLMALSVKQLDTIVEQYLKGHVLEFSKEKYTMLQFKRIFAIHLTHDIEDTLEIMVEYYKDMLNAIVEQVVDYQSSEDNINDHDYVLLEDLTYGNRFTENFNRALYYNDMVLTEEQRQYIIDDIGDYVKLVYMDNMSCSDNYLDGYSIGEIEEELEYMPEYMVQHVNSDMYVTDNGQYGYVNMSYDHIDAVLDIDAVQSALWECYLDHVIDTAKYSTYDNGHGWVRLHNYDNDTMIELKFNIETCEGDTIPTEWLA